jgi:transposase
MKALSMDLRQRAVALRGQGVPASAVAERLMISKRSVERAWSQFGERGELSPSRRKGRAAKLLAGCEGDLERWVGERPESTLGELAEKLGKEKSVKASVSSLRRALRKLGLSFKKNGVRGRAGPP